MKPILIRPLISEKTLIEAARGWYTFVVVADADKNSISQAISTFYHVTVVAVRTMRMHGKVRRVGKKMKPRLKPEWKKAIVRLKKGEKISVFEVTGANEGEAKQ